MKKILSFILAFAMIMTTCTGLMTISAAADGTDYVLADFSTGTFTYTGTTIDGTGWSSANSDSGVTLTADTTVKMPEASASAYVNSSKKAYLYSPYITGDTIFNTDGSLKYKYMNVRMYHEAANSDSKFWLFLKDATIDYQHNIQKFSADWSGWKIVSIDLEKAKQTLASFNKGDNTAALTDNFQFMFSNKYGRSDETDPAYTDFWFDSVWFSAEDPNASAPEAGTITSSIADGSTNVAVENCTVTLTASKALKMSGGSFVGTLTVSENDKALTAGTDYQCTATSTAITVKFLKNLTNGAKYSVQLGSDTAFDNGATLTGGFKTSFTAVAATGGGGDSTEPAPPTVDVSDDWVLADFSDGDLDGWKKTSGGAFETNTQYVRYGHSNSAKWSGLQSSNYVESPNYSGDDGIGRMLEYDYLNLWVYSDAANGQTFNVMVFDNDSGQYKLLKAVAADWSGWQLISIDISSYTIANFDKTVSAVAKDKFNIRLNIGGWQTAAVDGTVLCFDKIWLSNNDPTAIAPQDSAVVPSIADDATDISVSGCTMTLTMSKAFKPSKTGFDGTLTISENDTALTAGTDYQVVAEFNTINIKFLKTLIRDAKYTVTLGDDTAFTDGTKLTGGYTTAFTAGGYELADASYTIGNVSGGKLSVSATATNSSSAEVKARLIAGVFKNGSNEMTTWKAGDEVTVAAGASGSFSAEIDVDTIDGCYVRAFLWNGTDKMYPYAGTAEKGGVSALSEGDGTTNGGTASADKKVVTAEAKQSGDNIKIVGNNPYSVTNTVTIKILDPDGNVENINQIGTKSDGSFVYEVLIGATAKSGTYKTYVFGRGADEVTELKPYYLSADDTKEMEDAVNGASSGSAVATIINGKLEELEMTSLTAAEVENLGLYMYEQKPSGGWSFDDIAESQTKVSAIMTQLGKADWTKLDKLLAANHDVLLGSMSEYTTYSNKTETQRNQICQTVLNSDKAPFVKISDLRTVFKDAVANYQSSGSTVVSRPSGGGGGGTNSFPSKVEAETDADFKKDNTATAPTTDKAFGDMAGYEWAEGYVNDLYKAGVISAAADKCFRPGESITRAEFVKLVVCALNVDINDATCDFTDVNPSDWYYTYVAAAHKSGIVNGYEDGSFGADSMISRQEIATILHRAAQKMNVQLAAVNDKVDFGDGDTVADYAAQAVETLQKAGVINGDENGCFRPADNASRAESAKMISVIKSIAG